MDIDDEKRQPITPPERDKATGVKRSLIEAVAQITPLTAGLSQIYRTTHPPAGEIAREQWEESISERSNEHDARLDAHDSVLAPQTQTVEGCGAKLFKLMAEDCPDGQRKKRYQLYELKELLPEQDVSTIEDAVFEFNEIGILEVDRWLNGWDVRVGELFYAQLDHQLMGWHTEDDAALLINEMLLDNTLTLVRRLHEIVGWKMRRFNPAISFIASLLPDHCADRSMQPDYPTLQFILAPEDRATLKRFIREREMGK